MYPVQSIVFELSGQINGHYYNTLVLSYLGQGSSAGKLCCKNERLRLTFKQKYLIFCFGRLVVTVFMQQMQCIRRNQILNLEAMELACLECFSGMSNQLEYKELTKSQAAV